MKYRITINKLVMEPNTYTKGEMVETSHTIFEQTLEKDSIDLKSLFDAFNKTDSILIKE